MLQIRLCFFAGIFLFSYMSYSGCEDVFDSNSDEQVKAVEKAHLVGAGKMGLTLLLLVITHKLK